MKVDRFMVVESEKGVQWVVNVDFVIALRTTPAGGGQPVLHQLLLARGDGQKEILLTAAEAGRVESWLLEHASS